jgi:aspartate carbamoyltransferase catalytic subunit
MRHQHILCSQQFSRDDLLELFELTRQTKKDFLSPNGPTLLRKALVGRQMLYMFYEASTRTRISFCQAARHLGMSVDGSDSAGQFSSAIKGETLDDTIRVLCEYRPNVIVLRHTEEGAAQKAAKIADPFGVSIVNAGDGAGQHPTQALLDLFTIWDHFGTSNRRVVIGGDLLYSRTAHSLAYLLSKFGGMHITLFSPRELRMKSEIIAHLYEHSVSFDETDDLEAALKGADVIYWTRVQKERFADLALYERVKDRYVITTETMARMVEPHAILMHPLPRINEIAPEVDADPRSRYFEQAGNGMYLRMALFLKLLAA